MILAKAPLRVPFAGGLTDLKAFSSKMLGITISATIDKWVYVFVKKNVDGYINIKYDDVHEKVSSVYEVKHNHVRETFTFMKIDYPVDVFIMNDLNYESGLGSSGALTVALLAALHRFCGRPFSNRDIIDDASYIEMEVLQSGSGYHDHTISTLGGFKVLEYNSTGLWSVYDLVEKGFPKHKVDRIEDSLLLFYTGKKASTRYSLTTLADRFSEAFPILKSMRDNGGDFRRNLMVNAVDGFGFFIEENQRLKKQLPGNFDSEELECFIRMVKELGGYLHVPGGKIGGFLLIYCPDEIVKVGVRELFKDFREVPFRFEYDGLVVSEV